MRDWNSTIRDFEYDHWANKLWLANLRAKGLPSQDAQIFAHILSASEIWLQRLHGVSLTSFPEIPLEDSELDRQLSGWSKALRAERDDRVVEYRRTNGEPNSSHLSDICRHVVNHGTYHRGELRGLCLARNDADLPETDFVLFCLLHPVEIPT